MRVACFFLLIPWAFFPFISLAFTSSLPIQSSKTPPVSLAWNKVCGIGGRCLGWGMTAWWISNMIRYPDQALLFRELADMNDLVSNEEERKRRNREMMGVLKRFYELNSLVPLEADLRDYPTFERYRAALADATVNDYWQLKAGLHRALDKIEKMPKGPKRRAAEKKTGEIVDYQLRLVERLLRGDGVSRPEMEMVMSGAEKKALRRMAFFAANRLRGEGTEKAMVRIRAEIARRRPPLSTRPGDIQAAEEMMRFINLEISDILNGK